MSWLIPKCTHKGIIDNAPVVTLWSEIDLAVFGVPADRFYAAVAAITGLSAEINVDLVDAETCKTSLRDAIDRDGTML